MNWSKITTKLEEFRLEELSKTTKFIKSSNYKICGLSYVLGFFKMLNSELNTLEVWARHIGELAGNLVSPQALQGKLQFRHIEFSKSFLEQVLEKVVVNSRLQLKCCDLLNSFNKVFVEDSTCVTLAKNMFEFFPGTVNQIGSTSSARIQLRLELKSGNYSRLELQGYRDNDQKFSSDIVEQLGKGDLVLRDMGYWVLSVLRKISKKKAFFLSRYCFGTHILNAETGVPIDLFGKLRSLRHQGLNTLDINILLGKEEHLPVRLVAIKVPPAVEQKRKRKMKKDNRAKRSKDYIEMLGWTVFVTNVDQQIWKPQEMLKVYGYRWRVELIFKCWKSNVGLAEMFRKTSMVPGRAYITFYLVLAWILLFLVRQYNFFLVEVFSATGKILSLFKFANYAKSNFDKMCTYENTSETILFLARYCCQNKRSTKSQLENIYVLNSC